MEVDGSLSFHPVARPLPHGHSPSGWLTDKVPVESGSAIEVDGLLSFCPLTSSISQEQFSFSGLFEENARLRQELENNKRGLHATTSLLSKTQQSLHSVLQQRNLFKTRLTRSKQNWKNIQLHSSKRFGPDQVDALCPGGTLRGKKWSDETVMKAPRIHFACGSAGYDVFSKDQMPLPCQRVLQERIQQLKFAPGVLYEYFRVLSAKVRFLSPLQREAMPGFYDIAIKPASNPDPSTKTYIGKCTLPARMPAITHEMRKKFNNDPALAEQERRRLYIDSLNTLACKALSIIIGGMGTRYKFTGGFHLVGNNVCPYALKEFVIEVLQRAQAGLIIRILVSDMGNRPVWAAFGIKVGPDAAVYWVPHPIRPDLKLYIMPDPVHVFKNTVETLGSNKEITIAPHLVEKFNLPSNVVKLYHLRKAV